MDMFNILEDFFCLQDHHTGLSCGRLREGDTARWEDQGRMGELGRSRQSGIISADAFLSRYGTRERSPSDERVPGAVSNPLVNQPTRESTWYVREITFSTPCRSFR